MRVVIFSLGCKVNQCECDALLATLKKLNFEVSEKLEFADAYVLNTCAVTAEAERKSRQAVGRVLKYNPNAKVFVCGCASENDQKVFENKDGVVYVVGTANKGSVVERLKDFRASVEAITKNNLVVDEKNNPVADAKNNPDAYVKNNPIVDIKSNLKCAFSPQKTQVLPPCEFEELGISLSPRTRHYVKIQDGCNNFCSYCLVPYLRGRCRSRSVESVLDEVNFACTQTKEIVLTGINLSAYGIDLGLSLTALMRALKLYDVRIRLGSLEVNVINREFLEATKELKSFCDHFHLSLQSGDDGVLRAMNRHYTSAEFKAAVELIREFYPNAAITTDVIVGYPTEDEAAFENSCKFAREIAFADMHVFTYSPRKGTVAAKLKPFDDALLDDRHKRMEKVKFELRDNYNSRFIGKDIEVLWENKSQGEFSGHTKNYISVYSSEAKHGEIETVCPTKLHRDGLWAERNGAK